MTAIGQNIRKLRRERNMTQEELAARLNVSSQAVSKWENETTAPDISQVIPLTAVFGVSADVLFGIEPDALEREIAETKRIADLPETTNDEAVALWEAMYARYPNSDACLFELAESTECQGNSRHAAELFEKLLDTSTDQKLRSTAVNRLGFLYNLMGDTENALKNAERGGDWGTLKGELMAGIRGDQHRFHNQTLLRYYAEGCCWAIIAQDHDFPSEDAYIEACITALKILDLVHPNGVHLWVEYVYIALYQDLVYYTAKLGREEEMYRWLDLWYRSAETEDNLPLGDYRYEGNPYLDEVVYHHDLHHTHMDRNNLLEWLRETSVLDPYRGTERFRAFEERVRAMPGIEFPFGEIKSDGSDPA